MSGWRNHGARLPKGAVWHLSPRRFDPTAALTALLLHGLALLAWQPMAAPPPREVVLRAVVLPSIEAQAEAPRVEPPPPQRAPAARARVSRPAHQDSGGAWSEDDAPAMAAPSPPSLPAMPALADARSPARALAEARDAAAPAVTEAMARAASTAPRQVDGPPTFARQAGAALAMAQAAGAGMIAPAALAGRAAPLSSPEPSMVAAQIAAPRLTMPTHAPAARAANARLAEVGASLPSLIGPGDERMAPASPSRVAASPLSRAQAAERPVAAEAPRAARPDMVAGDAQAVATSVPIADTVASTALVGVARTAAPLAAGQPSGSGGLSEAAASAARAAPSAPAPALLARATPGRPMPVGGGGEGAFDSVDYADDNPEFVYPRLAIRLGLQGTVLLEVEVLPDGRPGDIRLKQGSGHEQLDRDALRQMATWRFKPQVQRGRAQATRVTVPVNYRLDAKGRP